MNSDKASFNHLILKYLKVHHEENVEHAGKAENLQSPSESTEFARGFPDQYDEEEEEGYPGFFLGHPEKDYVHDKAHEELFRKVYDETKKKEHQYALFDLTHIIPGFHLDEKILKKLRFRETLLISNIDDFTESPTVEGECSAKTVGGLCLNIQYAAGHQPTKRKKPKDEDFEQQLEEIVLKIKQEIANEEGNLTTDEAMKERLRNYKEELIAQKEKEQKKFLIHLSTTFDVNGNKAGSSIISWVDRNFHTLEERRQEYIFNRGEFVQQKILYFGMQNNKYFIRAQTTMPKSEERKYYSLVKTKDLVGEGANFVLMRYLAVTKFVGLFEMSTMYINGDMCRNIYECKGVSTTVINGQKVEICKIYRSIIEQCGIYHNCVTILTVNGKLVHQEWEGCGYIFNLNPLMIFEDSHYCRYQKMDLNKVWDSDIELMSKYLDCKTEAELKMKNYMTDHPEIHDMISDYIQSIILLKPENILNFTMEYFSSYQPYDMLKQVFSDMTMDFEDPPYDD